MPETYRQNLIEELSWAKCYPPSTPKDILIVLHNQLDSARKCLESVLTTTQQPFNLYVWDNASDKDTRNYLESLGNKIHVLIHHQQNLGFTEPNNHLASLTTSPYLILLNSDTVVSTGWEEALIGTIVANPKIAIVGYQGGLLDEHGLGCKTAWGKEIDYVQGWCLCLPRHFYKRWGLFDENLRFAYAEDADLSLRAKVASWEIYALHLELVKHEGSATIKNLGHDISSIFHGNHSYLKTKWYHYINKDRVLLRG